MLPFLVSINLQFQETAIRPSELPVHSLLQPSWDFDLLQSQNILLQISLKQPTRKEPREEQLSVALTIRTEWSEMIMFAVVWIFPPQTMKRFMTIIKGLEDMSLICFCTHSWCLPSTMPDTERRPLLIVAALILNFPIRTIRNKSVLINTQSQVFRYSCTKWTKTML